MSKKIKMLALSLVSLSAVILLAACGNGQANSKAINYSFSSDLTTLDSTMSSDLTSINTLLNVQDGLIRADKNNQLQLALAKKLTISKDEMTYTFTLRPNLKWSNGDALTAQNFVYAWQRAIDPKNASEYASSLSPIKNADAITEGKMPASSLGVKATNSHTLVVTLKQPTPYFKWLLTQAVYLPLDQKFVEKEGKAYGTTSDKTVYDGPYKFATGSKAWNGSNKTYSLVKNPNYYDASTVKTKEVNIQIVANSNSAVQLYKQGKLDYVQLDSPSLVSSNKKNKGFTVIPAPRTDYLEYNQKVKALQNQKIREAINLATDRQEIINQGNPYAKVATGVSPYGLDKAANGEDFAKYAAQPYSYNANKAAELWKEGLKEEGLTSLNLTLEAESDTAFYKTAAEYLQTSLAKDLPGLKISLKLVTKQQRMNDARNGNFQIILSSWGADYNEPTDFLGNFVTGASFNSGKFSSTEYDKVYKSATSQPDILNPEARYADYKAAEHILYEGSYINPIDFQAKPSLINPAIKGLSKKSSGLIYDLKTAYK